MLSSLTVDAASDLVSRQLSNFFPDRSFDAVDVSPYVATAFERVEHCFRHIRLKYFFDGKQPVWSHLNTDQYAMFLYLLSNTVHRADGDPALAARVYSLNKALHAIDVFYEIELPSIFVFQHPVGTVIGRARFSDYFFIYQRCSVGTSLAGEGPTFGEGVVMFGGSAVIGRCTVGPNTWLSVNAVVMDQDVPGGSAIFGHSPDLVTKRTKRDVVRDMFLRD